MGATTVALNMKHTDSLLHILVQDPLNRGGGLWGVAHQPVKPHTRTSRWLGGVPRNSVPPWYGESRPQYSGTPDP